MNSQQHEAHSTEKAYLKGVNAFRTIFLIPVVLAHIVKNLDQFGLDPYLLGTDENGMRRTLDIGVYGLGIFFGVSGFLITYLLRIEKGKRGAVDIKRFYVRRALRIFPMYYIQILFCVLIYWIFNIEYSKHALLIYGFYALNIPYVYGGVLPFLGHYWTLAVEEQFYLFWPWANRMSNKQLVRFSWILLIIFLISRSWLMWMYPGHTILLVMDHPWFQCMLIGAIFALYYLDHKVILQKIAVSFWCQAGSWLLLVLASFNLVRGNIPFDYELTTIAACLILVHQNSGKVWLSLENRFFNYIGRLSYSIYIIHNAIIFLCGTLIPWEEVEHLPLRYVLVVVIVFASSTFLGHLSFKFIEKPFLRLKERKYTYVFGMKA